MSIDLINQIEQMRSNQKHQQTSFDVNDLKTKIINCLEDNKAEDISVIELAGKSDMADCMIIASGKVARHVAALADHVLNTLVDNQIYDSTIEGKQQGDWALIDANDIIIHIFRPEIRQLYNLEKMWNSGDFSDDSEASN